MIKPTIEQIEEETKKYPFIYVDSVIEGLVRKGLCMAHIKQHVELSVYRAEDVMFDEEMRDKAKKLKVKKTGVKK